MKRAKICKCGIKGCLCSVRRGENHGRAKLTDREVELFRRMVESGELTQAEAVAKFEISKAHGSRLMSYRQR